MMGPDPGACTSFIVLSVALFLPAMPLVAQALSILETTGDFPGGGRLWISAEAAADEQKIIDLDLIGSDAVRRRVEKQRQDLGDRLPAEAYTGTVDRDHALFAPHLNQILFQGQGVTLFLPAQIRNSPNPYS